MISKSGSTARASTAKDWLGRLQSAAGRWAVRGIDLLYPPRCPVCGHEPGIASQQLDESLGTASPWAAVVCSGCTQELSADLERCQRCGEPTTAAAGCQACLQRRHDWRQIAVLSSYSGSLRDAVLRAKRPAGEGVVLALASLIVRKHAETLRVWNVDRAVPVPMHWLRRSLRGTSAPDELARGIAAQLGLPWSRTLVRSRATRMQNELPIGERPGNVEGAFRCRQPLAGERILLVDDVVTTGATLSACCRALLAAGAASVDVAVVARADRGRDDTSREESRAW
ncbi:MAG: phosphoribosyltransferase family protein [Planctomycetota bacterium]